MANIKAYESFFVCQQLLVTGVIIAGFIFGVIYLVHRIGLENREVDESNKEKDKEVTSKEKKEPAKDEIKVAEINKKKAAYREEILARFKEPVEETKEKVPTEKDGKQMVEEAVETASVFGDTTVAIDAEENKPQNVVETPKSKTKSTASSTKNSAKGKGESKPKNVVKKPNPKADAPKVDIMGEL